MIHHITFSMLDRKFPKTNTIAMSQHYVLNLLKSDNVSFIDKEIVRSYVKNHRQRFTALPTDTDDPMINMVNEKINGNNVEYEFWNNLFSL